MVKGYQHWPNWLQRRQNLKIDKNPFKADLVSLSFRSFLQTSLLRQAIQARGRNICRLQRECSLSSSSSLFCFFVVVLQIMFLIWWTRRKKAQIVSFPLAWCDWGREQTKHSYVQLESKIQKKGEGKEKSLGEKVNRIAMNRPRWSPLWQDPSLRHKLHRAFSALERRWPLPGFTYLWGNLAQKGTSLPVFGWSCNLSRWRKKYDTA